MRVNRLTRFNRYSYKSLSAERYQQVQDPDQLRIIIREIFTNLHLNGNSLFIEYRNEVKLIAEAAEKQSQLEKTYEPRKKASQQIREAYETQSRSIWPTSVDVLSN